MSGPPLSPWQVSRPPCVNPAQDCFSGSYTCLAQSDGRMYGDCSGSSTHRAFAKATPADGDLENWVRHESSRVELTASARSGGKDLGERRVALGKDMKPMVLSTKSTTLINATSAISFTLLIGSYCGCMVMALAVRRKGLSKYVLVSLE